MCNMKGIEQLTARMTILMLFFMAFGTSIQAADKTVTMKVGETKRLSLPSYITSKAIKGSQWTSTRPNEIEVVSQTAYSVTVKAKSPYLPQPPVWCIASITTTKLSVHTHI